MPTWNNANNRTISHSNIYSNPSNVHTIKEKMRVYDAVPTPIPPHLQGGGYKVCPPDYIPPKTRQQILYRKLKNKVKVTVKKEPEPPSLLRSTSNIVEKKVHCNRR